MDLMGVSQLEICPWALREGVILEAPRQPRRPRHAGVASPDRAK